MTVYLIQMALILVLGVMTGATKSEAGKRRFLLIACFVLFAVSAFRKYTVGMDTLQYWNAYLIPWAKNGWYEGGFLFLIRALNDVSHNPQFLLIFSSAIMTACVGYAVYKIDCNPVLSLFLYVSLLTYATYMNLMRQGLAAAIIVFALPWLIAEKRSRYVIAVLVASLFHSTAIVMLALVPLAIFKPSKRVIACYVVAALFLAMSPRVILTFVESNFDKYSTYSTSTWSGGNALAAPIMTVMDLLLLFISHRFGLPAVELADEEKVLFHGAFLQVSLQFLACFVNIFQRLTTFTSIFLALYVAFCFRKVDSKLRFLITYFIYAITAVFFCVIMVFRPQWHGVVPFLFFWQ